MCFTALPPLSGAQSPPRLEPFFSRAFLASDQARLRTGTVAISTAGALRTLLDSLPAKTATAAHARNGDQLPAQPDGNAKSLRCFWKQGGALSQGSRSICGRTARLFWHGSRRAKGA